MDSGEPKTLGHGYRAEYGSLRLIAEQREESVKIALFDKTNSKTIWIGDAPNMQAAKDMALAEAVKYFSSNPLVGSQGLPVWEASKDPFSSL